MEQALVRRLKPGTLDAYRSIAREKGKSLEAELRDVLEAHAPKRRKDPEELIRLSDEGLAMAAPEGPPVGSDSTLLIRWDRDTGHGKWIDDGWSDE